MIELNGPRVYEGDATDLPLPDDSVDCIVTSPPYNCNMPYAGVSDSFDPGDYEALIEGATSEMARVLKPGGRVWLNILHALPTYDSLDLLREGKAKMQEARWNPAALWYAGLERHLTYRDTLTWIQIGADAATAWGSVQSPNAPNLRGRWEPIYLFFKGTWNRGRVGKNDLTPMEFSRWSRNVWEMSCEQNRNHPAVFPAELPRRAIKLSTWPGDVVLDPFAGSGTTVKVAKDLGRIGIGFDLSPAYVERANLALMQDAFTFTEEVQTQNSKDHHTKKEWSKRQEGMAV